MAVVGDAGTPADGEGVDPRELRLAGLPLGADVRTALLQGDGDRYHASIAKLTEVAGQDAELALVLVMHLAVVSLFALADGDLSPPWSTGRRAASPARSSTAPSRWARCWRATATG